MIRVLIVEDEAPARDKLRDLLDAEGDVTVVAEAKDGREGVAALRQHEVDVVFLDVQMPHLDGFGVVREIGVGKMPLTVFVTAFDRHALAAFEVQALDYLLKPFAANRFRQLMGRVRKEVEKSATLGMTDRLERLLEKLETDPGAPRPSKAPSGTAGNETVPGEAEAPLRRLWVEKEEGRQVLLEMCQVDVVRADGNYLRFLTGGEERVRRGTLKALEARLDAEEFLRINRSEIVRLAAIEEVQPWFHGDYRVCLRDGSVLTWSRRYRARYTDGL